MLRRGPGLMRVAATTAVMAGTAGAVRHRQEQKYAGQQQAAYDQQQMQQAAADQQVMQQQMAAQQAQIQQLQAQATAPVAAPAPAAPAAPAGLSMDQKMAQLTQLGELKNAGVLTEEEFAAQKAAILAS